MTEPIGYNDDQFDDLPDEDQSWEKMRRLLDEDRRRRVLPFWLRFSALGVLLVALAIGGWIMFSGGKDKLAKSNDVNTPAIQNKTIPGDDRSATNEPENTSSNQQEKTTVKTTTNETTGNGQSTGTTDKSNTGITRPVDGKEYDDSRPKRNPETSVDRQKQASDINKPAVVLHRTKAIARRGHIPALAVKVNKRAAQKNVPSEKKDVVSKENGKPNTVAPVGKDSRQTAEQQKADPEVSKEKDFQTIVSEKNSPAAVKPDAPKVQTPSSVVVDSPAKKPAAIEPDTSKQKEAVAINKERSKKKRSLQWSMGIGFQQPLALGSQGMSDYNYKGNKSFVEDHLPGFYITAGKEKWFAGAEFNYGVPQPVQQVYFSQTTKYDPSNSTLNVERSSVEKMYYHQLTFTGNYFPLSHVSIGAGGGYHLLTGAVTERQLSSSNVITGEMQTTSTLAPVKGYKDSFLFKSTAAAVLQSECHWKRIKVGLRYTYALQPYLRYTQPDGNVEDVKNNTLQLMVRLQLWKK